METIQLSYLLYNIDEVKYSFMLSILFQNKHTFHESLFWAYELYKSCHKEYLWNFITKIYYDFYYIKYISFEKVLDIEYNAWKTKPDFKHIAKIIKDLHKQVIDITIFQSYYRNKNKIPDLINNITIDKLKEPLGEDVDLPPLCVGTPFKYNELNQLIDSLAELSFFPFVTGIHTYKVLPSPPCFITNSASYLISFHLLIDFEYNLTSVTFIFPIPEKAMSFVPSKQSIFK